MVQINIDLRLRLASQVYQAFNFVDVVSYPNPWLWSKDFTEATRRVALAHEKNGPPSRRLRGVRRFVTFGVRFNPDNTVKSAYALDENYKPAGKPTRPYPMPPALSQTGGISRRAATSAGSNQGRQPAIPEPVRIALEHVASIFPEVTHAFFSRESRWLFCGDDFVAPTFDGKPVDLGLLEAAADSLTTLPAAFTLAK